MNTTTTPLVTTPPPVPMPVDEATAPHSPPGRRRHGRPLALNDIKRSEICALVAAGCSLGEAARHIGCSLNTIRRKNQRNAEFHEQLRRSEMVAQLKPLRTMQQAAATNWRAAAWMLERAYPHRFARRNPAAFGAREARRLLRDVLRIVRSEVIDPFQLERIEKRIRATFEYTIRAACDTERTTSHLHDAMKFFANKDQLSDPLAPFGFSSPDLAELFRPAPTPQFPAATQRPSERRPTPADSGSGESIGAPKNR